MENMSLEDIKNFPSVKKWSENLLEQWGDVPDLDKRIGALVDFVNYVGRDPDKIVEECLRQSDEGMRIKLKARREIIAEIAEFEKEHGGRRAGNHVRSFLIHNGIAMSPSVEAGV